MSFQRPRSPKDEIDGIICFPRLCDKARLHASGRLHPDYQGNLGGGMDLWTCQFLGVDYQELRAQILAGLTDEEALAWAKSMGSPRTETEQAWWTSFMKCRGFRDEIAERLTMRKAESGLQDREDILTFMDYIDADDELLEATYSVDP